MHQFSQQINQFLWFSYFHFKHSFYLNHTIYIRVRVCDNSRKFLKTNTIKDLSECNQMQNHLSIEEIVV